MPVAGANVRADLGFNIKLETKSDEEGIAYFDLLPGQELSAFTAWTDDHRVGGFQLGRKPLRNPSDDTHVIELFDCRDATIRFVDGVGKPVAGVAFEFHVATPSPNYNYVGLVEPHVLSTDAAGEAVFRWLPDWESHHFYPQLVAGTGWVLDGEASQFEHVDGAFVYKVKSSVPRHAVTGHVETPSGVAAGGFLVQVRSFQGEQEGRSDHLAAFVDRHGMFSVDVLPGATYCAGVNDTMWTSDLIDLVPYEPATHRTSEILLTVVAGEEVKFSVTRGPQELPYPNVSVNVRETHSYSWWENGERRRGAGSRDRWLTTDGSGSAVAHVMPGKVGVSVFQPMWRVNEKIQVREGEPAHVTLHRDREAPLPTTGRLVLAEDVDAELGEAEVRFGSVDGNYDSRGSTHSDKQGNFTFEVLGDQIGLFAVTADQRAAGVAILKEPGGILQVEMKQTVDFRGSLLGEDDAPLPGYEVRALIFVEGDEDYQGRFVKRIEGARYETVTNERGEFTFEHLPTEVVVHLRSDNLPGEEDSTAYLDHVYLRRDEPRPPSVYRLGRQRPASTETFAERFARRLRDARLSGYHLMVIACADEDHLANFVQRNFSNYDKNPAVSRYMQLPIYVNAGEEGVEWLEQRGWLTPKNNMIHVWALGGDGQLLGELSIDSADEDAETTAMRFVNAHAPEVVNATDHWNHAFAEATATNRKVWARVSGRYCGPCFKLTRWIDDQRELLEKDYVFVRVDADLDRNGRQVASQLDSERSHGIPFFAIFSANGDMLEESVGPTGNIGYPAGFEGKQRLREMLVATRKRLTDEEIDRLIDSL
ncbi:MAG: thioredoxin family protein [Planctomycetota bacterium]